MADEIKQRLQDSTDNCIKSYEAWRKDEKNVGGFGFFFDLILT